MKRLYRLAGYHAGRKEAVSPGRVYEPHHIGGLGLEAPIALGQCHPGCLLRVQKCTVGRSQEMSSRVPARTRGAEPNAGAPQIHEPHCGQTQRVVTRPLSAVRWTARGSPWMRRQAPSARTTAIENALLVMRWQSVQWQVYTI